jgi:hypothetical protein
MKLAGPELIEARQLIPGVELNRFAVEVRASSISACATFL